VVSRGGSKGASIVRFFLTSVASKFSVLTAIADSAFHCVSHMYINVFGLLTRTGGKDKWN